ncbi:MAG TPA: hypothetical protein VHK28_05695 [Candidatus Limnocylindria bacterium]|nr:hypothetical protein [Candidatus Limnocylindria bacterium]
MDPLGLLETIFVGATVAGALTVSVLVLGVLGIAARGGVRHMEDFPYPGVTARAEEVESRLRHRYLMRTGTLPVRPAASDQAFTFEPDPEPAPQPVLVPAASGGGFTAALMVREATESPRRGRRGRRSRGRDKPKVAA